MFPYSCIVVAAVVLALVPGKAFSAKGYMSPVGILGFVGHAAAAGIPGGLMLASEPSRVLQAYGVSLACAVAMAAYLLLSRLTFRSAPASA